jgi:lipoprotein NlpI
MTGGHLPKLLALAALTAGCGAGEARADLLSDAEAAAAAHRYAEAVESITEFIAQGKDAAPRAYYQRGRWNFRLGRLEDSLRDFDRLLQLRPGFQSRLWERGITCYYLGRYRQGAEQFMAYQGYYANDVENSVWRYLCQARFEGVEVARRALLPIADDRRVPMMQIYGLYRGQQEPADVFAAARQGTPPPQVLRDRLFYANLYVGLYHDAEGDLERAAHHIAEAAAAYEQGHYMWAVAVAHRSHLAAVRARQQGKAVGEAPAR